MKKIMTAFIIVCIFFSCNDGKVEKKENKKNVKSDAVVKKDKIEDSAPENLSTLFYKYVPTKTVTTVVQKEKVTSQVNASEYKVIVDWMVSGKRYVKLKNMLTGTEYIVMEGDTGSRIKLVQRTLFSYKFDINGQIIEVKR
jgi:hypothetical protein